MEKQYTLSAMNCHYRFYGLESFFRSIRDIGLRHAEIWTAPQHFFIDYAGYDNPDYLKQLADEYGVEIICICPEQTNPKPNNIAARHPEWIDRVVRYYRNVIDVSAQVGAGMVLITSGWAFYDEEPEAAWERSVRMLKRISAYAGEKGVVLAMEALQKGESILANTTDDLQKLIDEIGSKRIKVCLDLGAMAASGETIEDYFRVFGKDVVHCHFVDGNPVGHLAWGDGTRNMAADLEVFEQYGYRGYLSLECANARYFQEPYQADKKSKELFDSVLKMR